MIKTLAIIQDKGGSGKTSTAFHCAAHLANNGLRVLLLDTDPRYDLTTLCGIEKSAGLYDLLVRDSEWEDSVQIVDPARYKYKRPPMGSLSIVPGNAETKSIAASIADNPWILHERIEELEGEYDLVVIDTSQASSTLHPFIYRATDYMLLPTQLEHLSIIGLSQSLARKSSADEARKLGNLPPIEVLGIVPTMKGRGIVYLNNLGTLHAIFQFPIWSAIAKRNHWTEAAGLQLAVWTYNPSGKAAEEALQMGGCLLARLAIHKVSQLHE